MRKVHRTRRLCSQKGFTLIELMAVLAILAIILAIAVPSIGKILDKAEQSADDSAIDLIEHAGELADVDKEPHDTVVAPPGGDEFSVPEKDSYSVPTLVEKGYLKLDKDSKFYAPGEYVTKKNKGGEYVYKGKAGTGSDDGDATPGDVDTALGCEEAEAQGYTCIYTPEEFDNIRDNLLGKYILMNDISLAAYANWENIGTETTPFKGILNGNGHSITELSLGQPIGDEYGKGLFGYVAYGKITNVSLVDVAVDGVDSSEYTSFLISWVESSPENNPDNEPLTLSNISLSGSAVNAYEFAPLVSRIFADNDVVVENIHANVDVGESVIAGAGLIYDYGIYDAYDGSAAEASFTVKNVTVDGSIRSSSSASGVFGAIDVERENAVVAVSVSDVVMNAAVSGDYYSTGFAESIESGYAETTYVFQNIEIVGDVTDTDAEWVGGDVSGFSRSLNIDGGPGLLVENVSISGKLTSASEVFGFSRLIGAYAGNYDRYIQDITISGDMTGGNVYLLGLAYAGFGGAGTMTFEDVAITSDVVSVDNQPVPLLGEIDMYDDYIVDPTLQVVTFRNFTLPANLGYTDIETELVPEIDIVTGGKVYFENIMVDAMSASYDRQ